MACEIKLEVDGLRSSEEIAVCNEAIGTSYEVGTWLSEPSAEAIYACATDVSATLTDNG